MTTDVPRPAFAEVKPSSNAPMVLTTSIPSRTVYA